MRIRDRILPIEVLCGYPSTAVASPCGGSPARGTFVHQGAERFKRTSFLADAAQSMANRSVKMR
jgi:hypothetical protein